MSLTQVPLACVINWDNCVASLATGNCRHWHGRPACGIKGDSTSPCLACFRLCTRRNTVPLSTLTLRELDKEPPARSGYKKTPVD